MDGRHELLSVAAADWHEIVSRSASVAALPEESRSLVASWIGHGWPVIRRRPLPDDPAGSLTVGLPLPPALGKLRLCLALPRDSIVHLVAPVSLAQAIPSAPLAWQAQLRAIIALGERVDLSPHVFGALLWQHLTGLPYLRPQSDLDLLWSRPDKAILKSLLDGLDVLDRAGPVRVDGEILLPFGAGVNWRELRHACAAPGHHVLVKFLDGAELRCASDLLSSMSTLPPTSIVFPHFPSQRRPMLHEGSGIPPSAP